MKTKSQKTELVKNLIEKLSKSKSVILTDYQGMTMHHLSELRKNLDPLKAELSIAKNTLLRLALSKSKMPDAPNNLTEGATAVLFAYEDQITPIKALVKVLKDAQLGKVKGGFLDGQFLDSVAIIRLSNLPGKFELRAKVVGLLASPLQGIVRVLESNIRNFIFVLDAIKIQRGGE